MDIPPSQPEQDPEGLREFVTWLVRPHLPGEKPSEQALQYVASLVRRPAYKIFFDQLGGQSARSFQKLVAGLFRKKGFDVIVGPAGADEGVDLFLTSPQGNFIVQCKRWKAKVGVPVVREVYGAFNWSQKKMALKGALIVTTSEFTDQAKSFVSELKVPLQLIDGRQLFELMNRYMPDDLADIDKGTKSE